MVRDLRNVSGVLEIWKLNDYGSGGWSLEHRIDLLQHVSRDDVIEPEIVSYWFCWQLWVHEEDSHCYIQTQDDCL